MKLNTLSEIAAQLEGCGYRSESGPLERNLAFIALKEMAEVESKNLNPLNMTIEVTKKEAVNVKSLQVSAGVRYWENATVNGVPDEDGTLIPFRDGDYWKPKIDLETGFVVDWPQGTIASLHYKVCDDGEYTLLDDGGANIITKDGYVPNIMCPKEEGYGDYIIMDIDENGEIGGFVCDLSYFQDEED